MLARKGAEPAALAAAALAWSSLAARKTVFAPDPAGLASLDRLDGEGRAVALTYADALWAAGPAKREGEGLAALQLAQQSPVSRALVRNAARSAGAQAGGAGIEDLIRQREEAQASLGEVRETLRGLFGKADPTSRERLAAAQAAKSGLEARIAGFDARLKSGFPAYLDLISPASIGPAEARALLKPDEALLILVPGPRGTHIAVLTSDGATWLRAGPAETDLLVMVRRVLWSAGASIDTTPAERAVWTDEIDGGGAAMTAAPRWRCGRR